VTVLTAVLVTVSMVHEYMHQRTGCEEQVRQGAENMSRMLREQEEPGDG
jgi:hypothetical protein